MQSPWLQQRKKAHAERQVKKSSSQKRKEWWQKKLEAISKKRLEKRLAIEDHFITLPSLHSQLLLNFCDELCHVICTRTRSLVVMLALDWLQRTDLCRLGG